MIKNNSILTIDLDWIIEQSQQLKLYKILLEKFKNANKIIFIKTHQLLLNYIEDENEIFNVDHHHDINYDKEPYDTQKFREGNWLYYLILKGFLKKYIWIHNHNSDLETKHLDLVRNLEYYNHTTDINILNNLDFNKIIICESFDYNRTTLNFESLKYICLSLFNDKTIIDETKNISSPIYLK